MAQITGPCIISNATLRTRDLAPDFLSALYALGDAASRRADDLRAEYADIFEEIEGIDSICGDVYGDDAGWLMEALFDALNEFAPEGTYFGSSEGDGACFGFWEYDEEDDG